MSGPDPLQDRVDDAGGADLGTGDDTDNHATR
jgi:hypothetical protein